ncbi:MAG: sterol desaturase family protein [Bacteroidota bacterium]
METLKYVGIIVPILFGLLGLEYYLSKRRNMEVYTFSDTIVNICCGMLERISDFFFIVVFYFVLGFMEQLAPFHLPANLLPFLGDGAGVLFASGVLTFILALMVTDWAAYWHHRLSHEVNMMWASHIVHHQSEELNITTVFRVSGFAVFYRALFFFWIPLVGFSAEMATSAIVFIGLFQFVTHTRLVNKLGILEYFFVTPSHHRVHHARNEQYIDKNYGHVFIIWDKIHGTFEPEVEEPEFGIISGFESANPYWAYLHYWADLYRRSKAIPGWGDKIRLWLMPPAWMPDGMKVDKPEFEVDERGRRKKFTISVPFRLQLYIGLSTAMILVGFVRVIASRWEIPPLEMGLLIVMVMATTFSVGSLLERRRWAWKAELGRLAYIALCLPIIVWNYPYGWVTCLVLLPILLFFAFWMIRMRNYYMEDKPTEVKNRGDRQISVAS